MISLVLQRRRRWTTDIYTAAVNWYINRNIRFMFNYLHGDVAKQISATNAGNAGSKFDALAMRTQVAF